MATDNALIVIAQADAGHTELAPADTAHTTGTLGDADLEHAEKGMPQLDPAIFPNLIFWLVVALVALYYDPQPVALPRIGTVMGERNDAISNDIEAAASLKRRAEEAEAALQCRAGPGARRRPQDRRRGQGRDRQGARRAPRQGRRRDRRPQRANRRSASARSAPAPRESVEEVARDTAAAIVERSCPTPQTPARSRLPSPTG